MKILIAGSRDITDFDLTEYIPDEAELIISGGAKGIDALAESFADTHKISKLIMRPDYKKYGKAAPLLRNKQMVDMADMIIVIWNGKSKGTKYTLDYAQSKNKKVTLVICNC